MRYCRQDMQTGRLISLLGPFWSGVVVPVWVLSIGQLEPFNHLCGVFNKFPCFFVQAFKIVVDSWKFTMLLRYILWDDWPIFMISSSNEQLQQQLEYLLPKPDGHDWWISKMQSGREDTLEERYEIKLCFKLGKNATDFWSILRFLSTV